MHVDMPYIRNEDTIVRQMYLRDAAKFRAYRSDAELGRFQGWTEMSDIETENFIVSMMSLPSVPLNDWFQLSIAHSSNNEIIGDIGLCISLDTLSAEIGYTVCRPFQNKGHAKRAVKSVIQWLFENLQIKNFVGICDSRNTPSIKVLLGIGFTIEQEYEAEFNGEICTEVLCKMKL